MLEHGMDAARMALEGFDRSALTAYTTVREVVRNLTKEEALQVIDEQIARLQPGVGW